MAWTYDEIEHEWFGDAHLSWDRDDVVRSFNFAEKFRGRDWVLGTEIDIGTLPPISGIGKRGGYEEFLRVYWFGKRVASIVGAPGSDQLIERLSTNDPAASEEATAIHLLRSAQSDTELEIAPEIVVGKRNRRPDFRIRRTAEQWIYVEVTMLDKSIASLQIQRLLQRVTESVMTIEQAFLLEIILNRDPTAAEEEQIVAESKASCVEADGHRKDVGDVATILVKSGDPAVIVPSLTPNDRRPKMAISRSLVGPGQPNRQLIARIPFHDQRAEDILRTQSRQLPRNQCGIVMVNVNRQPTAFESWAQRVPERFTSGQHTRVAAVMLFMCSTVATSNGLQWIPFVKLIPNPHAYSPLPSWIPTALDGFRAEAQRLTGGPD